MSKINKRPYYEDSIQDQPKRLHSSKDPISNPNPDPNPDQTYKPKSFDSYINTPNLPPKIKLLCEITSNTHSLHVEKVLEDTCIRVSQEDVEEVLKLSYGSPASAVKFFRWAGLHLVNGHSPYAWNLVVDLLGKNGMFEAMWDAIKSMKTEGLLSLATFASVFSSYVAMDRDEDAIMTFEVMDQYGCSRDVVALNSLLSAVCRESKTDKAAEFLRIAKDKILPDSDTYAILLEGWENEKNVFRSGQTFYEMVSTIGWDPENVPAYDSYINTLLKGSNGIVEAMRAFEKMKEKSCFPSSRFFKLALEVCVKNGDSRGAYSLWEVVLSKNGCSPDCEMYNSIIALQCYSSNVEMAIRLLDEMVYNGAFPNSQTYNLLMQFLIRMKKPRDLSPIFTEMVKNEHVPSHANCASAVKLFIDNGDQYMALKVWKCMVENYRVDLEETGNHLISGLRETNRIPEALKYAEDMIERRIKLNSATLTKLKQSLSRAGKPFVYEELLRKWKTHSVA